MVVSEISEARIVTMPCPFSPAGDFTYDYESAMAFRVGFCKFGVWLLGAGMADLLSLLRYFHHKPWALDRDCKM